MGQRHREIPQAADQDAVAFGCPAFRRASARRNARFSQKAGETVTAAHIVAMLKAPGLAYDAAKYLGERRIVAIGIDTPFIDAVAEGMLHGKAPPSPGTPPGMPFAIHHYMLTQMGIHHIENAKLDALAKDKVWTSCTMILPLLEKGAAGSAIRPVAIGVRGR